MTKFAYQYDYQIGSLDDYYHNKTYLQEYKRVASDLDRHHSIGVSANNGHETNISFGDTGGWYSWQDAYGGEIYLNEGHNTLTLGMNGSGFNINYIELVA